MSVVGRAKRKDTPDPNSVSADSEGRAPPHDIGAERATLCAVMVDPAAIDLVQWLRAEHFFSESHRLIWTAATELRAANRPCDSVNVASWLLERDRLAQIGGDGATGIAYLGTILATGINVANVESYAASVRDAWRVRGLLATAKKFAALAYVDHGTADEFLSAFEREAIALGGAIDGAKTEDLGPIVERVFRATADNQTNRRVAGIARGFLDYDALTLGLHTGTLEIVGARPGMGKTSLALCIARNVAARPPELFGEDASYSGVFFASCEMPKKELVQRFLAVEAHVDMQALRACELTNDQWARLSSAAKRIHTLPIVVDDTAGIDIAQLRAKVRRARSKMGRPGFRAGAATRLRVVVVDYLQLLRAKAETIRSREQEVSYIARELKELAKEEDVAVIALSQLNRALEARSGTNREPMLSDLRESGEIEQAADVITFVHRDDYYRGSEAPAPGEEGKTKLIVAKQRNGPTGTVFVRFRKNTTAFENL